MMFLPEHVRDRFLAISPDLSDQERTKALADLEPLHQRLFCIEMNIPTPTNQNLGACRAAVRRVAGWIRTAKESSQQQDDLSHASSLLQ